MPDSTLAQAVSEQLLGGVPFFVALALYAAAFVVTLIAPDAGRWPTCVGAAVHLAAMTVRGFAIGFFPLTNKLESFSAASLALALVAIFTWKPKRLYSLPLLALTCAALGAALRFPLELGFPPPLMRTLWYPLHVPLSFAAYAIWAAAAAAGLVWFRERDPLWLARVDKFALQGFGLWSLSMICGGFWGVVAWGAYFLWDVKVIWSVLLWFHYASFLHVRLTPSLVTSPWIRPALAVLGLLWVFVAYVGTSFFFGRSSHAF
jgi:ABC-type transport system involved in cytochrome c biogenesis permease subunit